MNSFCTQYMGQGHWCGCGFVILCHHLSHFDSLWRSLCAQPPGTLRKNLQLSDLRLCRQKSQTTHWPISSQSHSYIATRLAYQCNTLRVNLEQRNVEVNARFLSSWLTCLLYLSFIFPTFFTSVAVHRCVVISYNGVFKFRLTFCEF